MMTKDQLLRKLQQTLSKVKAVKLAGLAETRTYSLRDLTDLTFHHDTALAFRAAWVLEYAILHFPEIAWPDLPWFLEHYPQQQNQSCRRHYTKILMFLLQKNALPHMTDPDPLIEATFSWLADPDVPVAVKANCMDILFCLKDKDDWIADELKAQIEHLLKNGTAAIQARGKRVLAKLRQDIN